MPPEAKPKKKDKRRLVSSFVWTDEEAKYLKAVLKWKEKDATAVAPSHSDEDKDRKQSDELSNPEHNNKQEKETEREQQQKPAGEFRILVIGARGTGKTSILTRFAAGTFPGESEPPDPFYSRGCRHRMELDASAYQFSPPGQGQAQSLDSPSLQQQTSSSASTSNKTLMPLTPTKIHTKNQHSKRIYIVDALEFPSQHLHSDPMLEQALNLTEAGVLVYDVCDAKSLQLVVGIAEFVKDYLDKMNGSGNGNPNANITDGYPRKREFPLILIGNKADVSHTPVEQNTDDNDDDDDSETKINNRVVASTKKRTVPWAEGSQAAARITALLNTNAIATTNSTSNGAGSNGILSPTSSLMKMNPQGPVPFVQVSAKTGDNIDVIFPMLVRDILRYRWLFEQRQVREEQRRQQQQQRQQQGMLLMRSRDLLGARTTNGQRQGHSLGIETGMGYRGVGVGVGVGPRDMNYDTNDRNGNGNGKDSSMEYSSSSAAGAAVGNGLKKNKKTLWRTIFCCFGR